MHNKKENIICVLFYFSTSCNCLYQWRLTSRFNTIGWQVDTTITPYLGNDMISNARKWEKLVSHSTWDSAIFQNVQISKNPTHQCLHVLVQSKVVFTNKISISAIINQFFIIFWVQFIIESLQRNVTSDLNEKRVIL